MKKILIFALTLVAVLNYAVPATFNNTSVAAHEDFISGYVNPAALGTTDNSSLTFLKNFEEIDFKNPYALIYKDQGFSYLLESNDGTHQTIASGSNLGKNKVLRNLYLGSSWGWKSGSFDKGDLVSSLLYRPANYLSLGYVLTHPNDLRPQHRGGIAIRPFASTKLSNILEITTDVGWGERDDDDRGVIKPIVGMNTKFLGGFSVGASYNIEEEEVGIRFSLSNFNAVLGSVSNIKEQDDDSKKNQGYAYVSLNSDVMGMIKGTERKKLLDLNITGTVVDENTKFNIGFVSLKMDDNSTMMEILRKIEKAKNDPEIRGIFFKNNNFGASFAKRQEILTALREFKKTGKKVVFYYENISNINYAFAANIGDKIYLNPEGVVQLVGIGGASPYIKEMLDKLYIDFYNFRSHPYKTAGNMFSEEEMTAAEREVMERLYGDIYAEMVEMIRAGRGHKLAGEVEDIIDNGPYFIPQEALNHGLVDELVEWHELDAKLKEEFGTNKITKQFCNKHDYDWFKSGLDKVAVIYASGNIMSGQGQAGKTIGSETTARAIRRARQDPEVKGIILRVDSGGGSALASHIIAEEIRLCTFGDNKKPVIALMSGVAASGGYYISTWADEIIAEPTTITGSIGVIGMVPNLARLSNKVGINWSEVKFGKNSTSLSLTREWTEDEKEMFKSFIKASYDRFVNTVADSRGKSYEDINKIAMGQVWTGNQALKNGLIDKIGGFETAIASMKDKISSGNEVELTTYSGSDKQRLEISVSSLSAPIFSWYNNSILKSVVEINDEIKVNSDEMILYKTPYNLDIIK